MVLCPCFPGQTSRLSSSVWNGQVCILPMFVQIASAIHVSWTFGPSPSTTMSDSSSANHCAKEEVLVTLVEEDKATSLTARPPPSMDGDGGGEMERQYIAQGFTDIH